MNFDNNKPIYLQIVESIKMEILSGKWSQGEKLLSVRDLALKYQVNPNTVQKALQELENDNLIYTKRTNGKYVTESGDMITKYQQDLAREFAREYISKMNNINIDYKSAIKLLKEMDGE